MKRGFPILVLAILISHGPSAAWGLLLDPSQTPEMSQPLERWQVKTANGQVPQHDYTAAIIQGGGDILTGGPLAYGFPLSGITDISGPDWADIAAYLDSRAGLRALPTLVARYDNHGRPPLPAGVWPQGYRPDMVVLRPQSLWLIERSSGPSTGFTSLYQAGLPEPGTFGLICLGGILLRRSSRRRRSFST